MSIPHSALRTPHSRELYERRRLKAIAERWDKRASDWDKCLADPACHLNEDDAYQRFLSEAQRIIKQRRRFCATRGVIDAGCGTGLVLASVISCFAWGIGVDLSEQMIRLARQKEIRNACYLVGDCFKLASFCRKAGAVLSRGVLLSHYGPAQGLALLEAARAALVPHGFVAFDFLNAEGRLTHRHSAEDKTYLTARQAVSLAKGTGFGRARVLGEPQRRALMLVAERS